MCVLTQWYILRRTTENAAAIKAGIVNARGGRTKTTDLVTQPTTTSKSQLLWEREVQQRDIGMWGAFSRWYCMAWWIEQNLHHSVLLTLPGGPIYILFYSLYAWMCSCLSPRALHSQSMWWSISQQRYVGLETTGLFLWHKSHAASKSHQSN